MDKGILKSFFESEASINQWGHSFEELADKQFLKRNQCDIVKIDVCEVFRKIYKGDVKVIMYGSRVTGLTTKDNSDLDLLIDTSDNKNVEPINNSESENWILSKAAKYMKEKGSHNWSNVRAVLSCRTPVLKALHISTQMCCDVTVMSHLGVSNTELMALYIRNTPFLRQIILIVREWSLNCLHAQEIHNYALSLLVLFYMQVKGYVISVNELSFEYSNCQEDITGYPCVNYNSIDYKNCYVKPVDKLTLKDLLFGFFDYYSKFDFTIDVVCPLLGHPIKKKLFENKHLKKLPPEMHKYIQKVKEGGELFKIEAGMCIQDPLDLSHNLTKSTKKLFVNSFTEICLQTAEVLKNLS